ncbi:MAG: DNA-binding protein HU-beta [Bacteroidales bacterium]|jgi:DNA-binding protein HU-beta|nr:DNA-binding protein HU-beta [Bacteroidales bacterium]MDN5329706.1 DNA-binding protein HU-beta [Bacteroidales bacterium]
MNKAELINAIAANSGLSKAASKKALDATIAAITDSLKKGEKVSLIGFGTFGVAKRSARTGRNPKTQQVMQIPAKTVVKFKPGSELGKVVK